MVFSYLKQTSIFPSLTAAKGCTLAGIQNHVPPLQHIPVFCCRDGEAGHRTAVVALCHQQSGHRVCATEIDQVSGSSQCCWLGSSRRGESVTVSQHATGLGSGLDITISKWLPQLIAVPYYIFVIFIFLCTVVGKSLGTHAKVDFSLIAVR